MPLDREDLKYFADDIKTTIRDSESRLSLRIGTLEEKTEQNTIDVAVMQAQQQSNKSTAATWGAGLGGAVSMVATLAYQWFFGTPPPSMK